jgi:hypothetical protein
MILTKAQKKTIEQLQRLESIHYGVFWYGYRQGRTRKYSTRLDGKVCNALVRMGILIASEETTYILADAFKDR